MHSKSLTLLALMLFCLAIISPQGIGVRFSLSWPHIDLSRVFIILTVIIGCVLFLKGRWRIFVERAPVSCFILVVIIIWFLISASFSASPRESVLFGSKILVIGPLYALAFCVLVGDKSLIKETYFFMILTIFILILFANLEFILQRYLIPSFWRTSFYNIDEYSWSLKRVFHRGNSILSQGPYMWNHTLGGMMCVFSGLVWWFLEKKKVMGIVFCGMFFVAVYSIGMRVTTISVTVSMLVWLVYRKKIVNVLRITLALFLAVVLILLRVGREGFLTGLFEVGDIMNSAESVSPKPLNFDYVLCSNMIENFSFGFISGDTAENFLRETGTVGIRLTGMLQNFAKIDDWLLFGYGPGAFMVPGKVTSGAIQYDDPGLFLIFMFEYGLPMFLLVGFLILYTLFLGFRSAKSGAWPYAMGVLAWSVFCLSSWAVWPMLPAFAMVIVIEIWSKDHLKKNGSFERECANENGGSLMKNSTIL